MPNLKKHRYILAAVYSADENDGATHVILEIAPGDLELARRAMKFADQFDKDFNNNYGMSTLTTGSIGGEYVLTCIPEELEEWVSDHPDDYCAYARLVPRDMEPLVEQIIERWREDDLRWPSSYLRLKCSREEIHAEAEAKNAADCYVWTRDLAPIFAALSSDFETPELYTAPNAG
jgi:hypothetical protein